MQHLHTSIDKRKDGIYYRCPICTLPSPCALHEMCKVEGCFLPNPCTVHEPQKVLEMNMFAEAQAANDGPRRSRRGSIDPSPAHLDQQKGAPTPITVMRSPNSTPRAPRLGPGACRGVGRPTLRRSASSVPHRRPPVAAREEEGLDDRSQDWRANVYRLLESDRVVAFLVGCLSLILILDTGQSSTPHAFFSSPFCCLTSSCGGGGGGR